MIGSRVKYARITKMISAILSQNHIPIKVRFHFSEIEIGILIEQSAESG